MLQSFPGIDAIKDLCNRHRRFILGRETETISRSNTHYFGLHHEDVGKGRCQAILSCPRVDLSSGEQQIVSRASQSRKLSHIRTETKFLAVVREHYEIKLPSEKMKGIVLNLSSA